jgi:endothelin-converting enzyme/putative endopeptidase
MPLVTSTLALALAAGLPIPVFAGAQPSVPKSSAAVVAAPSISRDAGKARPPVSSALARLLAARQASAAAKLFDNSGSRRISATPASKSLASLARDGSLGSRGLMPVDPSVNPCADFFQYACGPWMAHNPIPADQSRWGTFSELAEQNRLVLKQILLKASQPELGKTPDIRKIGDLYKSCMDETRSDKAGIQPIQGELDAIAALKDKTDIPAELAKLDLEMGGALFNFGSQPDDMNAKMEIATVDQGGLGLPERDYYLNKDPDSRKLRDQYRIHIQKMFALAGESASQAALDASRVLAFETALAKVSMGNVERRDPAKVYHMTKLSELMRQTPHFDWREYLKGVGAPAFTSLNVAVPGFFKGLDRMSADVPLDDWKAFLRWKTLHAFAPLLSKSLVDENFLFFGKALSGQKEISPRWKRCVALTDRNLGDALGRAYVKLKFKPREKKAALAMVEALERAFDGDLEDLPWMTPDTKKRALAKLAAIANKIGYPAKWKDYSSVAISPNDLVGNVRNATLFEARRTLNKIGKPVDKNDWDMTPPTVNAYYDPLQNNINFPAGILQPPFYSNKFSAPQNLGGIGAVIGHEMTHGFDDQGRQFDADGNRRDWWTKKDAQAFKKREDCLVKEYSGFVATGTVHVNGNLTLGENTADNGGVRIALKALQASRPGQTPAADPKGQMSPEQTFFVSYAQIWCENKTAQAAALQARTDPHSPGRYRVNGVLMNMPEFQEAFRCPANSAMVRRPQCRVW